MARQITTAFGALTEEIQSVNHLLGSSVRVVIGIGQQGAAGFEFTVPQQFDVIEIQDKAEVLKPVEVLVTDPAGVLPAMPMVNLIQDKPAITDYTDLMSASPSWAPSKPAGTFRDDDLWIFVDIIRARRTA